MHKDCLEEVFDISKIKKTVPWTYFISDFNGEEIVGLFYGKEVQKTNQKDFRTEKAIKKYVKWKGYDNSFKVWTDKKDII